ncbi:MAG TPA: Rrf2 family transcriptional regulator [Polyangiaceae bacterium]|nr:Rrf2 family transcriptional regulator [Polyangiaceae bacterium]
MTGVRSPRVRLPVLTPGPSQRLLSRTAEYALRATSCLAAAGGGPLTAEALSPVTGIPIPYLLKVLRQLTAHGVLHAQRGRGGGFTLARPPEAIRFTDVLEAVGASPVMDQCAFGWGKCNTREPCALHPAWSRLNHAFATWARSMTLAHVVRRQRPRSRVRAS